MAAPTHGNSALATRLQLFLSTITNFLLSSFLSTQKKEVADQIEIEFVSSPTFLGPKVV